MRKLLFAALAIQLLVSTSSAIPLASSNRALHTSGPMILVTTMEKTVTLRRLSDGKTATFELRGTAHARLEPAGLFLAGGHRVTFVPMARVLGRLD